MFGIGSVEGVINATIVVHPARAQGIWLRSEDYLEITHGTTIIAYRRDGTPCCAWGSPGLDANEEVM